MQTPTAEPLQSQGHSTPLPGGSGWWLVCVLFIAAVISYSDRMILGALVDPLRADLQLTDSDVSLLQGAAFAVVYVFFSLPFGRLADRVQRVALLTAGCSLWCVATILCSLAHSFTALFVCRLFIGVGEAVLIPSAVSLITDRVPPQKRGAAIGFFSLGSVVGGPFGISLGGVLLSAAAAGHFAHWPLIGTIAPWRSVLLLFGVGGLVAPLLIRTLREPARTSVATDHSLQTVVSYFIGSREVLAPLYIALALTAVGDYGLWSWAPTTLSRRFHWQPDEVGRTFGLITLIAGAGGAFADGWISDLANRWGGIRARLALNAALAAAAALAAILISTPNASLVIAGIGLWVLLSTAASIGAIAVLQSVLERQFQGTGMAILTFLNTLIGLGGGPTLVALIGERMYSGAATLNFALSTVAVPAASMAVILYCRVRSAVRSLPESSAISRFAAPDATDFHP